MTKTNKILFIVFLQITFLGYTAFHEYVPFDVAEMKAAIKTSLVIQKQIKEEQQQQLAIQKYEQQLKMERLKLLQCINETKCPEKQMTYDELWCKLTSPSSITITATGSTSWNINGNPQYDFPIYKYFNPAYKKQPEHIFHTDRKAYIHAPKTKKDWKNQHAGLKSMAHPAR